MNGIRLFIFLSLVAGGPAIGALQLAWESRYDGGITFGTNRPVAMSLDFLGNIIVAGSGLGTEGNWDYLTIKYAATGNRLWVRRLASPGGAHDQVRGLALDRENNVLVTGTSLTVKYSPQGTVLWTAPYGGRAIALETNGNILVTGFSDVDFATVKISFNGTNIWMREYDRIGKTDVSQAIAVDDSGNAYVGGVEQWICDRVGCYVQMAVIAYSSDGNERWISRPAPGAHGTPTIVRQMAVDSTGSIYLTSDVSGFVATARFWTFKLNSNNSIIWSWVLGSGFSTSVSDLKVDGTGHVLLTGAGLPEQPTDPTTVYTTVQLDAEGHQIWLKRYGNVGHGYHKANALTLDEFRNVYVTGSSPGPASGNDIATIKYDTNGKELWMHRYNGPFNGDDQATALAVDQSSGAVYVAGFSQSSSNLTEMVLLKYAELENIQLKTNKEVRLQFFGEPGQVLNFQASTNFPDWEDIGSSVTLPDGICSFDDTNAPLYPYRFYRITNP